MMTDTEFHREHLCKSRSRVWVNMLCGNEVCVCVCLFSLFYISSTQHSAKHVASVQEILAELK